MCCTGLFLGFSVSQCVYQRHWAAALPTALQGWDCRSSQRATGQNSQGPREHWEPGTGALVGEELAIFYVTETKC